MQKKGKFASLKETVPVHKVQDQAGLLGLHFMTPTGRDLSTEHLAHEHNPEPGVRLPPSSGPMPAEPGLLYGRPMADRTSNAPLCDPVTIC